MTTDRGRKRALICGVTGQDGAYLAALLLERGYEVVGTSRSRDDATFSRLARLGIVDKVRRHQLDPLDRAAVQAAVEQMSPGEIYNLSAQSSVGKSFEQPAETKSSIVGPTVNWLEAIRVVNPEIRYYSAGSGECFGDTSGGPATESSPFRPLSPYAAAKSEASLLVDSYRRAYGLHASTGFTFNHESPLRPVTFVTQKIVQGAARIKSTGAGELALGTLDISRDWGWAPEYVEAMWRMLNADAPSDFLIATGRTVSLQYFVQCAFDWFGMDWSRYVTVDERLKRPSDPHIVSADPSLIGEMLGWRATTTVEEVVANLCAATTG